MDIVFHVGNHDAKSCDNTGMECESARLAISEAIDEGHPVSSSVDEHIEDCAGCRRWQEAAHQLRRATLRPVMDTKHSAVDVSRVPQRFVMNRWVRFALAWAAVLLIAWNIVAMFAAGTGSAIHLERHQAAFDVALGIAFLFVVWRPDRAYGMVPFAATFTIALSISAIIDLINGASTPLRESAHLVELSGLGLLWVLGLAVGPGGRRNRHHAGSPADS
jgi:predicted anti-sigma-YlaC factor YlaD